MVKKINVNVSYNSQTRLFECDQREFFEKVAEHFKIDIRDVELFSVKKGHPRSRITPHDITDLMNIEIVHKSSETVSSQRQLRSHENGSSAININSTDIITKLRNNTPLSGYERKTLVEWLQNDSHAFSRKRKIDEISSIAEVHHKKVQVNFSSIGCKDSFAQTDPFNAPNASTHDETVANRIKKLAVSSDVNEEEVASLMTKTFDDRRNFIFLKTPPVSIVKDKYPLLFCVNEVKNELGRIFYTEKCEEFISNMHKFAPLIIDKCKSDDELYRKTEKSIKRAYTDIQKEYARVVGSVFILTTLMEEDWRFIHLQDYPHGSDDIYPHIDASCYSLKDLFFDNVLYRVVVEGLQLCEASNLLEAILCLVASFFIFNIDYPDSCRRTLTMFEKIYLNANDTKDLDDPTAQMVKMLQLEAKSGK